MPQFNECFPEVESAEHAAAIRFLLNLPKFDFSRLGFATIDG